MRIKQNDSDLMRKKLKREPDSLEIPTYQFIVMTMILQIWILALKHASPATFLFLLKVLYNIHVPARLKHSTIYVQNIIVQNEDKKTRNCRFDIYFPRIALIMHLFSCINICRSPQTF
jgi:hypothetical protein